MYSHLPVELQRECLQLLDVPSLKSLRLTSKSTLVLATEALFRIVNVLPNEESAEKYHYVLKNKKLKSLVRRVIFNTAEYPNETKELEQEEPQLPASYEAAMLQMGEFPRLKEVELKFARMCAVIRSYRSCNEVRETEDFRAHVLQDLFFAGLNHPEHPAVGVESLTIKNLQDATCDDVYESGDFQMVLSRLKELHLQIATEVEVAAPEHSINKRACHVMFNNDLFNRWLKPAQHQLTRLTIYGTDCLWGLYPFCDLRSVHFPRLKSLSLGNFTIVHDWQVDWILSHGPTLEELILDECPIITTLKFDQRIAELHWPDLQPFTSGRRRFPKYWKDIDLRWHHVFPRFQSGLPHLRHFAIGRGNWHWQTMFEERYEMIPRIVPQRYYMFDGGIGPSQWVGHDDYSYDRGKYTFSIYAGPDRSTKEILFPTCNDEDMDALVALLDVVNARALSS